MATLFAGDYPIDPFASTPIPWCSQGGKRWRQSQIKKSMVFAQARIMLAERAADAFSLKDLATKCGTTVQGLHYCVGKKNDILQSAINDYNRSVIARCSDDGDISSTLARSASYYVDLGQDYPEYTANAVNYLFGNERNHSAVTEFAARTARASSNGDIRPNGSLQLDVIARQCFALCSLSVFRWSQNKICALEIKEELVETIEALLEGALELSSRSPARPLLSDRRLPSLS